MHFFMKKFYRANITAVAATGKIPLTTEETCLCFNSFYLLSNFQGCLD